MTSVTLGKSRVRECRTLGSVRAKAKWLSYSTLTLLGLIDGSRNPWVVMAIRESIRDVVASALAGPDPAAQDEARTPVDRLGAEGHHDFRDLLDQSRPA